jgi:hypothetical protein
MLTINSAIAIGWPVIEPTAAFKASLNGIAVYRLRGITPNPTNVGSIIYLD